jgi:hypothetical protein
MIAVVLWAAAFAVILVLEALGLTLRGHDWPTISDMFRAATRPVAGRWIFFALWLWAGWHFFIRGWHFFLRGSGAAEPGHGSGGGKSAAEIVTQVVTPLLVLYLLLVSVLVIGYRAWRTGRIGTRTPRRPFAFVRHSALTAAAGYGVFVGVMGLYTLLVGQSASGVFGSAAKWGAFLAFGVALPVFCLLSFAETWVGARRRHGDAQSAESH